MSSAMPNSTTPATTMVAMEQLLPAPPPSRVVRQRGSTMRPGTIHKLAFAGQAAERSQLKLTSVVVTIQDGATYDDLFGSVPRSVGEGERAETYRCRHVCPTSLQQVLELGVSAPICQVQADAASLAADLAVLEPGAVLFNWECCSGCSHDTFETHGGVSPVPLIAFLLNKGYTVMVSDFSLSALIAEWDAELLGPNPFVKVGKFDRSISLRFDCDVLKSCSDSAQLQVLGELCSTGECHLHAMSGTKAYAVDSSVRPVRVLTVASQLGGVAADEFLCAIIDNTSLLSEIGEHKGLAGHTIVDFPNGGRLHTSSCHWIELSKLDADERVVLSVAEERFGAAYAADLRDTFDSAPAGSALRRVLSSKSAAFMVQTSTPTATPQRRDAQTS